MPKKWIQRMLLRRDARAHTRLGVFGNLLDKENLWHINRRSVATAFAIGSFCAFIPAPFQMLIAALAAIVLRGNVAIAALLVWITNPLTMGPIFYTCYRIGQTILGTSFVPFEYEMSLAWLADGLSQVWQPLLLGCLLAGSVSALASYTSVRLLWRLQIISQISQRQKRRNGA